MTEKKGLHYIKVPRKRGRFYSADEQRLIREFLHARICEYQGAIREMALLERHDTTGWAKKNRDYYRSAVGTCKYMLRRVAQESRYVRLSRPSET